MNSVSPSLLEKWERVSVLRSEHERRAIAKMTEAERIAFFAVMGSMSGPRD